MSSIITSLVLCLLALLEPLHAQDRVEPPFVEINNWEYYWGDFPETETPGVYRIGREPGLWTPFLAVPPRPPGRGKQEIGWMRAKLPDHLQLDNPALLIPGFDLAIQLFLEDEPLFAYGGPKFQGYRHALIYLPSTYAGSYIYVRLFSDHTNLGLFKGVSVANYEQHIVEIIRTNAELFGMGLFFIVAALVIGLIGLVNWEKKEILALAFGSLCTGLVLLFNPLNMLSQFFFQHYLLNHLLFQFSAYTVTVPFSIFAERIFPARKLKIMPLMRCLSLAYGVAAFVLSWTGFIRPMSTFFPGQILLLTAASVILWRVGLALRDRERHSLVFGLGFFCLFVGTARDIFVEMGLLSAATVPLSLHYWVLAFFFCMITVLVRSIRNTYQEKDRYLEEVKHLNHDLERKVEEQTRETRLILKTIQQGILIIDDQACITANHSLYSRQLLGEDQLTHAAIDRAVLARTDLSEDQQHQIQQTLRALIAEDSIVWELNASVFPRSFHLLGDTGKRSIEAEWMPFLDEQGCIRRVLLTLRDVTEILQYRQESLTRQEEWQALAELVHITPDKFQVFREQSFRLIQLCKDSLQQLQLEEAWTVLVRHLHTLKGNSRTIGLNRLSRAVHLAESRFLELRRTTGDAERHETALERILELETLLQEYQHINDDVLDRAKKWNERQYKDDEIRTLLRYLNKSMLHRASPSECLRSLQLLREQFVAVFCLTLKQTVLEFEQSLPVIARSLGKPMPQVHFQGPEVVIHSRYYPLLKDVFMHLFNNALDHGLEDRESRQRAGKPGEGHITVGAVFHQEQLILEFSDDGRGLNLAALRQRCGAGPSVSDQDLAARIFDDHVSTKESVTEISGRGIGLAAVQQLLKTEGGSIRVELDSNDEHKLFRKFKFVMVLPSHICLDDDQRIWQAAS